MVIDTKEKALDCAIRDFETKDPSQYGFIVFLKKSKPYENYMSNKAWTDFRIKMANHHCRQFEDGDGGELIGKKGRYGYCPPKMACFGSSSRFIYQYSKTIEGFCFEKQLPTRIGHIANLDGYLPQKDMDIFVEAKCREIYSSHKTIKIKKVYQVVYDFIKESHPYFTYEAKDIEDDNENFKCTFKYANKVIEHFDIKQLICHFLGITANVLENRQYKPIKFIYLIFNPEQVKEKIDPKYRDTILSTY